MDTEPIPVVKVSQEAAAINLGMVNIKLPDTATPEKPATNELPRDVKVLFNDIPLNLHTFGSSTLVGGLATFSIEIQISNNKPIANVSFSLAKNKDGIGYAGKAIITNKDRNVKGLGNALWGISRKLMQEFADKLNVIIVDKVTRYSNEGSAIFSEKWEEIYPDIHTKEEYQNKGNDTWELKYFPKAK